MSYFDVASEEGTALERRSLTQSTYLKQGKNTLRKDGEGEDQEPNKADSYATTSIGPLIADLLRVRSWYATFQRTTGGDTIAHCIA